MSDGEIEFLDEDADIVQQCVQNVETLDTNDNFSSTLLIERVSTDRTKSSKRKKNIDADDDDFDPIEHIRAEQNQRKRKSQYLPRPTKLHGRDVKIKTPNDIHIQTVLKPQRTISTSDLAQRLKLGIRIPDYDDPLCLPVRAVDKDNESALKAWNDLCLEQFKRTATPLRVEDSESVSSRRTIVLQNDRTPAGKIETHIYSKVSVENKNGAKKAELVQSILPKYREKKVLTNIRFVQKKRKYSHYKREVILTKEMNRGVENLVAYDPKEALSSVYRMSTIKSNPTIVKEDDDRKVLEELTCSKVCAHCYQGSWRGTKKHFNKKVNCPICDMQSPNVYKLLPHLKTHSDKDVREHKPTITSMLNEALEYHYKCRICKQSCPSIKGLKEHVDTHKEIEAVAFGQSRCLRYGRVVNLSKNSKNATKDKKREFLRECIELYRDLPALWQTKNKIYYDRDKKTMAYGILLAKYNEMFPQATKEDLKRKINSLRTNYRKELKKLVNSMKSGVSTDCIYEPRLWYFEEMNFLRDQELSLDSETSMDTHTIATTERDEDDEEQKFQTHSSIEDIKDSQLCQTPYSKTNIRASKRARKSDQILNLAYERLSEVKDEYHHWGIACAADLRKMERTQQLYAKKAIAEVIMEGQLGRLHRQSVKINENPPFHSPPQYNNGTPSPSYSNQTPPSPSYNTPSPSNNAPSPSPEAEYVSVNPIPSPSYYVPIVPSEQNDNSNLQ